MHRPRKHVLQRAESGMQRTDAGSNLLSQRRKQGWLKLHELGTPKDCRRAKYRCGIRHAQYTCFGMQSTDAESGMHSTHASACKERMRNPACTVHMLKRMLSATKKLLSFFLFDRTVVGFGEGR